MEIINFYRITIIILIIYMSGIYCTKETNDVERTSKQLPKISIIERYPLASLTQNENEIRDVNRNEDQTKNTLSRVKRQFYYDPYYRRRPIPIPIFFGGGGWYGGRGFGFGGRGPGFGGRGFGGGGGRGFGGGRGIGGFGGRGIGGGGRGGGRG